MTDVLVFCIAGQAHVLHLYTFEQMIPVGSALSLSACFTRFRLLIKAVDLLSSQYNDLHRSNLLSQAARYDGHGERAHPLPLRSCRLQR